MDYGARFYDPSVGRFTTVDPLADHSNQIDKSPYAAMWNNPIKYNDPDGRCPICPWLDAVIDIGAVVYDVGVLINEKITTGSTSAVNWTALGADVSSIAIPMTVGAGAAVRAGAKVLDKANDSRKVLKNADAIAEGRKFEADELAKSISEGQNVTGRNRLVPQNGKGNVKGNRMDTDQLRKNDDGTFSVKETKLSSNTKQSKGQNASQKHVESGNGIFEIRTENNKFNLRPGDKIQVVDFQRVNKYDK